MKRYCIITIEREYASGGSQVGKLVGQALGIPVYGREILEIAAREGGTTPEYIEHLEETDTNSLLYSLVAMAKTVQGQLPQISKTDQLNLLEARIIQRLAQEGPCVIVGRCAGWVLREQPHVLNVFIHADRQERLRRAVEENTNVEEELGDLLFAAAKAGRFAGVDPEHALQLACDKFIRRFRRVEALADKPLDRLDLPALEGLWRRAKEET